MDSLDQAPAPAPGQRRSGSNKTLAWIVITLLLLITTGVLAYLLSAAQSDKNVTENKLNASQKKVAELERKITKVSTEKTDKTNIVTDTNSSDSDAIIKLAVANARADVGSEKGQYEVTVDKLALPFARANVSSKIGSGSSCIFKKVDDQWLQLYCAQGGSPETDKLKVQFGVPASMIQS